MASLYSYIWKPLTCWHCDKIHSTTEEFCKRCNGWTLPTQDECHGQVVINWEVFVMRTSDSETCRERTMKDAGMAISGNKYVAVLAVQPSDYAPGSTLKTAAVFLHRPGGDKKMSLSTAEICRASPRYWNRLRPWDWEKFMTFVGSRCYFAAWACK
jgi:hypothetical protein